MPPCSSVDGLEPHLQFQALVNREMLERRRVQRPLPGSPQLADEGHLRRDQELVRKRLERVRVEVRVQDVAGGVLPVGRIARGLLAG